MKIGRIMGSFAGLGAWTSDQTEEANRRVGALNDTFATRYDAISAAERAGYPPTLIAQAWRDHDVLAAEIDAIGSELGQAFDVGTPGSWQSFTEHLARVEERLAAWEPLPSTASGSRTGMIIAATLGSIAIAGTLAGLIWLGTARRRW